MRVGSGQLSGERAALVDTLKKVDLALIVPLREHPRYKGNTPPLGTVREFQGGNAGMWCPRCHTEVAAEIAQNGQSLLCTSCGTEIQRIYAPSLHPDTRSARELLERWSKSDLLDAASGSPSMGAAEVPASMVPPVVVAADIEQLPVAAAPLVATAETLANSLSSLTPSQPPASPVIADAGSSDTSIGRRDRPERPKPERSTPKPRTVWRVDAAHSATQPVAPPPVPPRRPHFSAVVGDEAAKPAPVAPPPPVEVKLATAARTPDPVPMPREEPVRYESSRMTAPAEPVAPRMVASTNVLQRRLDSAHESLGGPHFDLQSFLDQDSRQPGKSESIWGQVLAYAGVGLITVGTTLVLWSWFGKTPQYAPTGWLVCTIGQMLLFLGVTTLISGGMQQTSHEVTRRVEYLGDRILRFENTADQLLRGPHFQESRERSKAKSGQASQADGRELDG